MTLPRTIGFIGAGHMATALIEACPSRFSACKHLGVKPHTSQARYLLLIRPLNTTTDNAYLYTQVIGSSSPSSRLNCQQWPSNYTRLYSPTCYRLPQDKARKHSRLVSHQARCVMPNLPVGVCQGCLGLYADAHLSTADRHQIQTLCKTWVKSSGLTRNNNLMSSLQLPVVVRHIVGFLNALIDAACQLGIIHKHVSLSADDAW